MTQRRGTPLWVTIGCGCGLLVAFAVAAVVAAGYFGASAFKGYVADMKDPASRAARAGDILGAEELPEGYTAHLFLHIPWFFDMVMLSDSEPLVVEGVEDEELKLESDAVGEHLFVYFALPRADLDQAELTQMLRGKAHSENVRTDIGLELDSDQELARGELELGRQRLSYVSHLGELDLDDGDVEGIYSQMLIECPGAGGTRAAVWFERGGERIDDSDRVEIAGTPADPEALSAFMAHFDVCGE